MVRKALSALVVLAGVAALAACTSSGTLTPQGQKFVTVACQIDATAQPVAVQIAPAVAPQLTALASVDQVLVHPEVQKACTQALAGSKPTAVMIQAAPAAQ